jgi:hypothetical protein
MPFDGATIVPAELARRRHTVTADRPPGTGRHESGGAMMTMTCPWCDEDGASDVLDARADTYQCPACGTCVDLVEEPVVLDPAA